MLDYRECSIEEFNTAMQEKDNDVQSISNFRADATQCAYAGTSYASGLPCNKSSQEKDYSNEVWYGDFPFNIVLTSDTQKRVFQLNELNENELIELRNACNSILNDMGVVNRCLQKK